MSETSPKALSASVDIAATPECVFALWADAASWPTWDPDIESASLDGPFAVGSRGSIKPKGAPRTRIEVTAVQEPTEFAARSRFPGCRMIFEHELVPLEAGGCRVTHTVRFEGPLAGVFRRLISASITRGLPGTMQGLKVAAEQAEAVHEPGG